LSGLVFVLVAGGIAWATIPDPGAGLIHGCYRKTTGALRVIDPSKGQRCASSEAALNWNQRGINWRGNWRSAAAYAVNDAVALNGSSFVARVANTNSRPPSKSWAVLAAKGAPSASGHFAEFYALMPPDNSATVGAGTAVSFPQDGPQNGSITRLTSSTFQLSETGTYRVTFDVPVTEAGQLELTLNGTALAYTVVGRATGTSQVAGDALVSAPVADSVLAVVNPPGESTALTITPDAGGVDPVSASLVIQKLG
jgi:hypothetical protein